MPRWPRRRPAVQAGRGGSCAVILVEGLSDQSAVESLAARSGRNLGEDGVFVVPMGGATNIGHFLALFGPRGLRARLAGLCDEAEEELPPRPGRARVSAPA